MKRIMKYSAFYESLIMENNLQDTNNIILYRGAPTSSFEFDRKLSGIWLSTNIETAKLFNNNIHKYKLKSGLKLLKIWSVESRKIFTDNNLTTDLTTPNQKLIDVLKKYNYDGYIIGDYDNYYIFDSSNLKSLG